MRDRSYEGLIKPTYSSDLLLLPLDKRWLDAICTKAYCKSLVEFQPKSRSACDSIFTAFFRTFFHTFVQNLSLNLRQI